MFFKHTDRQRKIILLYALTVSVIGLPVGLVLKLPVVWGLSIAGIVIAGARLMSLRKQ